MEDMNQQVMSFLHSEVNTLDNLEEDVEEEGGWREGCSARLREDGGGDGWRDRWDR